MKNIQRHHSRQGPDQIFDLVAEVERYPEFLPWVLAARTFRRKDNTVWTRLTMGTSFLNKQFTTVALLDRPRRIEISSRDPMFERFEQTWTFDQDGKGGSDIEYRIDLKFKSNVLQALVGASFAQRTNAMLNAYVREAQRLYQMK